MTVTSMVARFQALKRVACGSFQAIRTNGCLIDDNLSCFVILILPFFCVSPPSFSLTAVDKKAEEQSNSVFPES